jgi:GNAT superfamily N-acetyltransferase
MKRVNAGGFMFDLTQELIDDILFWMESQNGHFAIDTMTGGIVNLEDLQDGPGESLREGGASENRYADIPEWGPVDGFGLMENFTASLKNPPVRKKLAAALNQGRGVFRAFKNALAEFPHVEKLWFSYKEKELEKTVRMWYAGLCEEAGIQKIGKEPEETDELIIEDFLFAVEKGETHASVIASNSLEVRAGKISAKISGDALSIEELFVEEAFRGLGLGKGLLKKLLSEYERAKVTIDVPLESEVFSRVLLRENFTPVMTRFEKGASQGNG